MLGDETGCCGVIRQRDPIVVTIVHIVGILTTSETAPHPIRTTSLTESRPIEKFQLSNVQIGQINVTVEVLVVTSSCSAEMLTHGV
jgi:hypothetical protein